MPLAAAIPTDEELELDVMFPIMVVDDDEIVTDLDIDDNVDVVRVEDRVVALGFGNVEATPMTEIVYGVPEKVNTSSSVPASQEQPLLQQ